MKKNRALGLIILSVFILVLFLIGPAAPLLTRLGVKPFCISGKFPRLQVIDCPQATSPWENIPTPAAAIPSPRLGAIPIIFDDDGSIDGLIALLYFLSDPAFDVVGVTISYGEAHPQVFAPTMLQFLARLGRSDIPVGAGRETPLEGANAFPGPWRENSDHFWGFGPPEQVETEQALPAAQLMVEIINTSPVPIMVFLSGAHTNLAEALRLDEDISANILSVHIMGGAVYVPGNIYSDWPSIENSVAEWNIWADPVAADEVFRSGLPLHLTPLDATNQVRWTQADMQSWLAGDKAEGILAGKMLEWMLVNWYPEGAYIWDLAAALHAADEALCPDTLLRLEVNTAPGPQQARLVTASGTPNVAVCLQPDVEKMKARSSAVLGQ